MVEVPKGRQTIATGVSPWVHRSRTPSPGGAKDKTAAPFRPVGADREHPPHLRLTPQAIVLHPFYEAGSVKSKGGSIGLAFYPVSVTPLSRIFGH